MHTVYLSGRAQSANSYGNNPTSQRVCVGIVDIRGFKKNRALLYCEKEDKCVDANKPPKRK
jgi:hypothetical protein